MELRMSSRGSRDGRLQRTRLSAFGELPVKRHRRRKSSALFTMFVLERDLICLRT